MTEFEKQQLIATSLHSQSRFATAIGQKFADQAPAKAGHNVHAEDVRVDRIPVISSVIERDRFYLIVNAAGKRIVGGQKGSRYVNILKFLDKVSFTEVPNTNGESWRIFDDVTGKVITSFIAPTDKLDEGNKLLSEGYKITIYDANGNKIPNSYGYVFDAHNGILKFRGDATPAKMGWGTPTIEAFIYVGKYVSDSVDEIDERIETANEEILKYSRQALAIQPFQFTTAAMERIGEPYVQPLSDVLDPRDAIYMQQLHILIPAYVFETTAMDTEKTFLTELRHHQNGDTEIFIEVPWSMQVNKPILWWDWNGENGQNGIRSEQVGDYIFTATAFVMNNGDKINVKETINYGDTSPLIIPSEKHYEYSTPDVVGWSVPKPVVPHPMYGYCYNNECDENGGPIDININLNGASVE